MDLEQLPRDIWKYVGGFLPSELLCRLRLVCRDSAVGFTTYHRRRIFSDAGVELHRAHIRSPIRKVVEVGPGRVIVGGAEYSARCFRPVSSHRRIDVEYRIVAAHHGGRWLVDYMDGTIMLDYSSSSDMVSYHGEVKYELDDGTCVIPAIPRKSTH